MRSLLCACVLLSGCVAQPVTGPVEPVEALVKGLTGEFSTAAQVAALPANFARVPTPGQRWLDSQYALMREFPAPAPDERAIYLEWRKDGPDGEISRQRVWTFAPGAEGSVTMRFFTLSTPADWVGQSDERRGELARDGLLPYPDGCRPRFNAVGKGYDGVLAGQQCRIVTRDSGRVMYIHSWISVDDAGFEYGEAGVLESGFDAFRVPEGARYRFRRVR